MKLKAGLTLMAVMAALIVIALYEPWKGIGRVTPDTSNAARESVTFQMAMDAYNVDSVSSAYKEFLILTGTYPANAEMWAWRAEAARRLGKMDDCETSARRALRIDPCNSFAHCVLGDFYNPQFDNENGNADSTWTHVRAAVSCDPDEGNAWMSIWIEAMRRGESALEKESLVRLRGSGFFADCIYAMNRWALRDVPRDCIFITGGDLDTYPARCLQAVDGFRSDVAVINFSLLNLPWYAELMASRWQLPLPMSRKDMDAYIPTEGYTASDGSTAYTTLADVVLRGWSTSKEKGTLARPLIIATTCGSGTHRNLTGRLQQMGYGYLWVPTGTESIDVASVIRSLEGIDGADFAGRPWTERDKSSLRRATAPGFPAAPALYAGLIAAQQLLGEGKKADAKSLITRLRGIARAAGVEGEYAEYFDQLDTPSK